MKTFKLFVEEYRNLTGEEDTRFRSSGSSDAVKFKNKDEYFLKSYHEVHDRENTELAAGEFYKLVGIKTTNPELGKFTRKNGETLTGLSSVFINNLRKLTVERALKFVKESPLKEDSKLNKEKLKKIALLYIVSVFIRNHDVAGMSFDNTMVDESFSELYHMDAGGSFHYKAMGGMKPKNRNTKIHGNVDEDNEFPELPDYPEELESMMWKNNSLFLPIIKHHPEILKEAGEEFENKITPEKIEKIILETWNDNPQNKDGDTHLLSIKDVSEDAYDDEEERLVDIRHLISKLQKRRNFIIRDLEKVITKLNSENDKEKFQKISLT